MVPKKRKRVKRKPTKRMICDVHDEIQELALDVEAAIDDMIPLKKDKQPIIKLLRRIIADAKEAKEYGQSMEDRLSDYKSNIESLGFQRKKP